MRFFDRALKMLANYDGSARWIWGCAFATAIAVGTLSVLFYPVENPDSAARYALMAEEFSKGNWFESFHPRFCVLFQVLTGVMVWATGCTGISACQIVSALFMGLAIVPFWHVMHRIFKDCVVAWVSVGILLVIPRISGDAMNGLRDTGRILAIALWTLGFLRMVDNRPSAWLQAGGLFIMVTLKIDCFAPAAVMCAVSVLRAVRMKRLTEALCCVTAFVSGTAAVCTMVWVYTGWFVPAPQYIAFLKGLA